MIEQWSTIGCPTNGKPINLAQLQAEAETAGVVIPNGLGLTDELVHTYDTEGIRSEFNEADTATMNTVIAAHVGMREKTNDEYAAEFNAQGTSNQRQMQINNIVTGLSPREQVPL